MRHYKFYAGTRVKTGGNPSSARCQIGARWRYGWAVGEHTKTKPSVSYPLALPRP
jgi:hypothetical protein